MSGINRREFMKRGLAAGSALALGGVQPVTRVFGQRATPVKAIILGFDGMDPHLTRIWMDQGELPAFARLRRQGGFTPLFTSNPPQSPVAWANFITGMNPGGHGVFDFNHRDPDNYMPIFSSSESLPPGRILKLGKYRLPLSGGKVLNLMHGKAFWQHLEDHDIPATIFKLPSNYPPMPTKQRTLSGMNTPDMLGTYGLFNFYTTAPSQIDENVGGGRVHEVYVIGNRVDARLPGPVNTFLEQEEETSIDFKAYIDPKNAVAKIVAQDHAFLLRQGEWSDWKRVSYSMMPTQSVSGICRFYLKEVRPEFKLYVSPVNIDPAKPALPISTPDSYATELADRFGSFYTQGLPGDFKALNNGILDEEEFLTQDELVLDERRAMFDYELNRFDSGLLFYYVSSTDQRSHMFWRFLDKNSPGYNPKEAARWSGVIKDIYKAADRILAKALNRADRDTVVMVVSDHGFSPFRRAFNANTWLLESGYHSLINKRRRMESGFFDNTDWSATQAYAYGLNGLYLNQRGRESEGIVSPGADTDNLLHEIARKLEAYRDPITGEQVVRRAYLGREVYSGPQVEKGPDIVLGFNGGYRISWSSPYGQMPMDIMEDNTAKWSGDHCVSPDVVPGIFLCNRPIKADFPAFTDITPSILQLFGIDKPQEMVGNPVIGRP